MKAVVIHDKGDPDQLVLADRPDPVPGPGEVVIDVAYAGCNWADTQVRQGIYPHPMVYPMVLGFEVSGKVAALGAGVTGVKVGDRVAAFPEKGGAYEVIDTVIQEHGERSMLDGQIHDVIAVSNVIASVKEELEKKHGPLREVCVAAAGRALKTMFLLLSM